MILSLKELFDIVVMTAILGIIFQDLFRRFKNPFSLYGKPSFDWQGFKFATAAIAPAVILHELGHKFIAMGFGLSATFNAAYGWLGFGLVLKLLNVGFIFFVPAYVSIHGEATALTYSIIAFAGPAMNLILWMGAKYVLDKKLVKTKYLSFIYLTKQINMFLFIFNMLPIPGFDGFKVYQNLLQYVL